MPFFAGDTSYGQSRARAAQVSARSAREDKPAVGSMRGCRVNDRHRRRAIVSGLPSLNASLRAGDRSRYPVSAATGNAIPSPKIVFSRDIRRRITAQLLPRNQRSRWLNVVWIVRCGTCRNGGSARPSWNILSIECSRTPPPTGDPAIFTFDVCATFSYVRRRKRQRGCSFSSCANLSLLLRDYQRNQVGSLSSL